MNSLNFNYNWNNKLNCNFFSTIRKPNNLFNAGQIIRCNWKAPDKEHPGKSIITPLFDAEIIHIYKFQIKDLLPSQAWADTGYNLTDTIAIIRKIYALQEDNWQTEEFELIYLKRFAPLKAQPIIKIGY